MKQMAGLEAPFGCTALRRSQHLPDAETQLHQRTHYVGSGGCGDASLSSSSRSAMRPIRGRWLSEAAAPPPRNSTTQFQEHRVCQRRANAASP
jgi:hypothetical protein